MMENAQHIFRLEVLYLESVSEEMSQFEVIKAEVLGLLGKLKN